MLTSSYTIISDIRGNPFFIYLSESVTNITGYTPEELVGQSSYSVLRPEDRPVFQRIGKLFIAEHMASLVVYVQRLHKDGHLIDLLVLTSFASGYCVSVARQVSRRNTGRGELHAATARGHWIRSTHSSYICSAVVSGTGCPPNR